MRSSSSAMLRRLEESSELKYSQRSPSITLWNTNIEENNAHLSVLKQTSLYFCCWSRRHRGITSRNELNALKTTKLTSSTLRDSKEQEWRYVETKRVRKNVFILLYKLILFRFCIYRPPLQYKSSITKLFFSGKASDLDRHVVRSVR